MHSTGEYGMSTVPAFLHKLWTLVEDEATNELIAWDPSGNSFHVFDQSRFSKEVLPLYFKHNNIASFIRQLNMYGFRKVTNVEHGALKNETDDMEFLHPFFQRDQEHLLENIKRKVSTGPTKSEDVRVKQDEVGKVLMDVHQLRGKQESINQKFETLKRENEALWREVATLRQKHLKQEKIVNKLIQFLVTIVGPRGLSGMKRPMRRPLMLNDAEQLVDMQQQQPAMKVTRMSTSDENNDVEVITESAGYIVDSPPQITSPPPYSSILDQLSPSTSSASVSSVISKPTQTYTVTSTVHTAPSPTSTASASTANIKIKSEFDLNDPVFQSFMQTSPNSSLDTVALNTHQQLLPSLHHSRTVSSVNDDVDGIHDTLEGLRELLASRPLKLEPHSQLFGFGLDHDTLSTLFHPEAPVPPTPEPFLLRSANDEPEYPDNADNQLVQYVPTEDFGNLFDLDLDLENTNQLDADQEISNDDLGTPIISLSSPLAERRKQSNSASKMEDVM